MRIGKGRLSKNIVDCVICIDLRGVRLDVRSRRVHEEQ